MYTLVIMTDTTVLNIKIDKRLKSQAQAVAKAMGVPMSIVVASNLREFVRTRSITISDPPRLRPEVEKELLRLSKDAKAGKNLSPAFNNADEAVKWLESEVKKENQQ